jgi:hypothetical protein
MNSPAGTAENVPGLQSWVRSNRNMSQAKSKRFLAAHGIEDRLRAGFLPDRAFSGRCFWITRIVDFRVDSLHSKPRTSVLGHSQPSLAGLFVVFMSTQDWRPGLLSAVPSGLEFGAGSSHADSKVLARPTCAARLKSGPDARRRLALTTRTLQPDDTKAGFAVCGARTQW